MFISKNELKKSEKERQRFLFVLDPLQYKALAKMAGLKIDSLEDIEEIEINAGNLKRFKAIRKKFKTNSAKISALKTKRKIKIVP